MPIAGFEGLHGLSGPEARRATSGASSCRGGLQRELRSQPVSPCRVPSCRSPVHVFAFSYAPPPTAVSAPIHLQSLAAIASEKRIRQVQKRLSIKERAIKSLLSLCSCQSPLWCFIGVKYFLWLPRKNRLSPGTIPPLTSRTSAANTAENRAVAPKRCS